MTQNISSDPIIMGALRFYLFTSAMIVLIPYIDHPYAAGLHESQRESDGTIDGLLGYLPEDV